MVLNYTAAIETLISGGIIASTIDPFTLLMGNVFYIILYCLALLLLYIKTEEFGVISITIMLTGAIMIPLVPPNTQIYFWMMVILGVALTLFRVFTSGQRSM